MGVSMVYQTIPPQSALFRSVQENAAYHALLAWFYPLGMFSLITPLDSEPAEEMIEETLESCEDLFGPEPQGRKVIDEFRNILEQTRSSYPGIETRQVTLQKSQREIRRRLPALVQDTEETNKLLDELIYGERKLAPHFAIDGMDTLWMITSGKAGEGVNALSAITPEMLFPGTGDGEDYCRESFSKWKALLDEASSRTEWILVGSK
jgi:hypothetical protein